MHSDRFTLLFTQGAASGRVGVGTGAADGGQPSRGGTYLSVVTAQNHPSPNGVNLKQVNGVDLRRAQGSLIMGLLSKTVRASLTSVDLSRKGLEDAGAVEAVAAMLAWSASTLTRLDLRS